MPFHDLNVPYTTDHAALQHTLAFHAELGYSVVALAISETGKLPTTPQPIPVSSLSLPRSIPTVLTRVTITISDATQNHRLASIQPHYSLVALRPTNEKALQLCCNSLECDLISLDFSQRLPFVLRFKTVASALQRGVRFEIAYSPGIQSGSGSGSGDVGAARRNLIGGASALIRATRGRGIILSSEAKNALGVRGPHDVINLAQIWGLGQERGKEALCEEAGKVVQLAGLKRTSFRGVVDVIDGGGAEKSNTPPQAQVKAQGQAQSQAAGAPKQATNVEKKPKAQAATGAGSGGKQPAVLSNGTKRKASVSSITTPLETLTSTGGGNTAASSIDIPGEDAVSKPLSKREMKRRAKKARLESNNNTAETDQQ